MRPAIGIAIAAPTPCGASNRPAVERALAAHHLVVSGSNSIAPNNETPKMKRCPTPPRTPGRGTARCRSARESRRAYSTNATSSSAPPTRPTTAIVPSPPSRPELRQPVDQQRQAGRESRPTTSSRERVLGLGGGRIGAASGRDHAHRQVDEEDPAQGKLSTISPPMTGRGSARQRRHADHFITAPIRCGSAASAGSPSPIGRIMPPPKPADPEDDQRLRAPRQPALVEPHRNSVTNNIHMRLPPKRHRQPASGSRSPERADPRRAHWIETGTRRGRAQASRSQR